MLSFYTLEAISPTHMLYICNQHCSIKRCVTAFIHDVVFMAVLSLILPYMLFVECTEKSSQLKNVQRRLSVCAYFTKTQ